MTKIVLDHNVSNIDSALGPYNGNFQKLEDELQDKVLYRKNPEGEPNAMENPLDMNGERIYNLPAPLSDHEAARFVDLRIVADYPGYFYGPLPSDPTVRPDGTAINPGDYYFNTTTNTTRFWNAGTGWRDPGEERASEVQEALNVLISSLGSAAYTELTDYATASQGLKADTALQVIQPGDSIVVDDTDPIRPLISVDLGDISLLGVPIGGYITPLIPPPTNDPRFRYILCTAGQDGPGGYNEGVLTDESITGSAPLVVATAKVNLIGSPFNGLTIHHINTERRFVGAGESEALEDDTLQNLTGKIMGRVGGADASPVSGVFKDTGVADVTAGTGATGYGFSNLDFKASNSTDARTSDHTQPRAHRLLHYRRIK